MLEDILNLELVNALKYIRYDTLCELRLKSNQAVIVNILGENYYLSNNGFTKDIDRAIIISMGTIQRILDKISNNSMYTINDELTEGYITIRGGIRVGVCGEVVRVNGIIKTIKNISSLNFRFPHRVKNCSLRVYDYIVNAGDVKNTLIVSSPGAGKTTMLKDLIYQISHREKMLNILVVDERKELSETFGIDGIDTQKGVDVISNSTKKFAFNNGIRSMNPDIIVTDEISIDRDMDDIENALTSGVKVIATIHANSVFDLKYKSGFTKILQKKLFDRYVVLSKQSGIGTVEGVFDSSLNFLGV